MNWEFTIWEHHPLVTSEAGKKTMWAAAKAWGLPIQLSDITQACQDCDACSKMRPRSLPVTEKQTKKKKTSFFLLLTCLLLFMVFYRNTEKNDSRKSILDTTNPNNRGMFLCYPFVPCYTCACFQSLLNISTVVNIKLAAYSCYWSPWLIGAEGINWKITIWLAGLKFWKVLHFGGHRGRRLIPNSVSPRDRYASQLRNGTVSNHSYALHKEMIWTL